MGLELLQFIKDGSLLSFRGPVRHGVWELIGDLDTAKVRAWNQTDEFPCWTDLRESVAATSGACRLEAKGLSEQVRKLVFAYTPWPFEDLEDDIGADLAHCASYEALGGRSERLYTLMIAAYSAGGWPCGWSGSYPAGNLCVFWPTKPVTVPEPNSAHDRRVELQKRRAREQIERLAEPDAPPVRGGD